jgi:hypothetical protein
MRVVDCKGVFEKENGDIFQRKNKPEKVKNARKAFTNSFFLIIMIAKGRSQFSLKKPSKDGYPEPPTYIAEGEVPKGLFSILDEQSLSVMISGGKDWPTKIAYF